MSTYAIARLPLLSPNGDLIVVNPNEWQIQPALRQGMLRLRNGSISHSIDLRTILAAEVSEENEINDIKKTLKRMALTGVGSALFWEGRRGGIGAGLLDLSARGAEKRNVYGGSLVFRDTSVVNFMLFENDYKELERLIPEEAFDDQSINEAKDLLHLLERMRKDGQRALEEYAVELIELDKHLDDLRGRVETGKSFVERDQARTEADQAQNNLTNMRYFFRALLVENGLNYKEFAERAQFIVEQNRLLSISGPSINTRAPLSSVRLNQDDAKWASKSNNTWKTTILNISGTVAVIIFLFIIAMIIGKR